MCKQLLSVFQYSNTTQPNIVLNISTIYLSLNFNILDHFLVARMEIVNDNIYYIAGFYSVQNFPWKSIAIQILAIEVDR